jgi:Fic family protein
LWSAPVPGGRPSRTAIHARLAEQVAELRARLGGLPSPEEAEGIWTDIWYQEAHHSTAIEGNTLIRKQVEVLLKEGRAVGDKELREYLEVQGYADAAKWVYGQALAPSDWPTGSLLSLAEVRHVHALMIGPAWNTAPHPDATDQEGPGQWRRHDIRTFPRGMEPPSWTEIHACMTDWVAEVDALRTESGPTAEVLARLHASFERIHPFIDGNGRTGRLLTNLMLVRLGYPPVIIQKRERGRYLSTLDRADHGDVGPLGELFARAILDNLNRFVLPAVAGPARLVPLEALATADLKLATLRKAIERGRLRAARAPNGSWRSSRQWVDEYLARRWVRGEQQC